MRQQIHQLIAGIVVIRVTKLPIHQLIAGIVATQLAIVVTLAQ